MTNDEILQAAKEATNNQPIYGRKEFTFSAEELKRFASIIEKDERIAELETYLKSETKDKESAQESFGIVWSKWQRCEKRIAQLERQRDELLSDLAEAKRSAEFNFEQYQDVGRLLHEECEKTEKLLAALEKCRKELSAWMRDHGDDIATQEAVADARAAIASVKEKK